MRADAWDSCERRARTQELAGEHGRDDPRSTPRPRYEPDQSWSAPPESIGGHWQPTASELLSGPDSHGALMCGSETMRLSTCRLEAGAPTPQSLPSAWVLMREMVRSRSAGARAPPAASTRCLPQTWRASSGFDSQRVNGDSNSRRAWSTFPARSMQAGRCSRRCPSRYARLSPWIEHVPDLYADSAARHRSRS